MKKGILIIALLVIAGGYLYFTGTQGDFEPL